MLRLDGYDVTPGFERTNSYYTVEVPNAVETVTIIPIPENESSTIDYNETVNLDYGDNTEYITVTSSSGAIRTYTLKITRVKSKENALTSLTTSIGELDPLFDSTIKEYTIDVPEGTKSINLAGTISDNASVVGLGKHELTIGENEINITVTSQSGETNVYTVTVNRPAGANLNLTSLVPSAGAMTFDNEIDEYFMEVNDNVSTIFFTAVPEDPKTKVVGTDTKYLNYGDNQIYITVTAEDGSNKTITINIVRTKDISSIFVKDEELIITQGQTVKEEYVLDPVDTTYPDVRWISLNERVATVDQEGNITGVGIGYAVIKVQSTYDEFIFDTVTVNVMNNVIKSEIYDINREIEDYEYIIGMRDKTTIENFVNGLDNTPSTIHIFDKDDNEITDLKSIIGTYMKVQLIIRDTVMDELTIVVRGDPSGDGYITAVDATNVLMEMNESSNDLYKHLSIDINRDNYVTAVDFSEILLGMANEDYDLNKKGQ
jgi:hypothetical protein